MEVVQTDQQQRLTALKSEVNRLINDLYDEICQATFMLDPYRIPIHGIKHPQSENPVNLF